MSNALTPEQVAADSGVHVRTVRRWIRRGVAVQGTVVRLGASARGTNYRVTPEALAEFDRACSAAMLGDDGPAEPAETAAQGRRRAKAAKDEVSRLLGRK